MAELFMFISYILGTVMGLYFAHAKIKNIIGETIDNLILQGYLKAEKMPMENMILRSGTKHEIHFNCNRIESSIYVS